MPRADSQKKITASKKLLNLTYYSFFALIIVTPLIFLKYIESSFDLAKKASLIIIGGLFIIITLIYLISELKQGARENGGIFIDKKFDPAIIFFLIAALLSTIFSIKPYVSFQGQYSRQIGFITFLYLSVIYFLSSQILRNKNKFALTLLIIELTGVCTALYTLMQYFHLDPFGTPLNAGIRPVSTLGHSTFAGGFMALLLPFSIVRIFKDKKPYTGIILSVIFSCAIIITRSRASYAAALTALAVMLILYPFAYKSTDSLKFKRLLKINLSIIFGFIITLAVLIFLLPSNPFVDRLIKVMDLPGTARWLLWRDSLEAYKIHPFTGSGIATFPSVFEYFISYELKIIEPKNYFDHAHNVFINTLVTMGVFGAAAYIYMLFCGLAASVKAWFNSSIEIKKRFFFLSVISSLSAYTIYALGDFEDTSILLYLFIIFAMLKVVYAEYYNTSLINLKIKNSFMYAGAVFSAFIILFCAYSFYEIYRSLKADVHYRAANEFYSQNDIKGAINEFNNAVAIDYECAEYKFTLASCVQAFCLKNQAMSTESKNDLLRQAEQELERARPNFFSQLQYQSLLTVIKLQLGETEEAEKLKAKVFKEDTLIINFRTNLARYYFATNDSAKLMNELNAVFTFDPFNSDATIISASYYLKAGDKKTALRVCDNYLAKYPHDPYVNKLKTHIIKSPEIKKAP